MRSKYGLLIAAVVLLMVSAGCKKGTEIQPRALHVAALAGPVSLNPVFLRDSVSAEAATLLHPQLLTTNPLTLAPEPRLITSWEVKEDNLTYLLSIADGVTWSDGTSLTAEDVAFTLRVICHPDYTGWMYPLLRNIVGAEEYRAEHTSPYADGDVAGIKILAENTLEVRLNKPHAPFLTYLTFAPLPVQLLRGVPVGEMEAHQYSRTVNVSAGPYLLQEWRQDEYLHVTANPNYFLGKPEINDIYYRMIPNPESQLIEILAGKLDLIPTAVKVEDIKMLEQDAEISIHRNQRLVYDYIGFNVKKEGPLSNIKVRRALSLLLDKNEIVENLLLGNAEPLHGPILPLHFSYDDSFMVYEENLPAARSLLLSVGYPVLQLKLIVNAGNIVRENVALMFKEQAAKVGIDVKVTLLEWEAFLAAYREGEYDLVALGRGVDADPDLTFHWHSDSPGNTMGYGNTEVDALLEQGAKIYNRDQRSEIYQKVQKLIVEDAPMIWLYSRQAVHAAAADLQGLEPHPETLFYNVHQWRFAEQEADQ